MQFLVEKNWPSLRLWALMKHLLMLAILALAAGLVNGCASTPTVSTNGDPVPGEKTSEESRLQPGTGTSPNASLKW
jgi:hypothetical protein